MTQTCNSCGAQITKVNARFCARCGAALPPQPASVGLLLRGRYRIVKRLGAGGMASVYQAQDMNLSGMMWAVKEMTDTGLTDATERQQAIASFQAEAQVLAKLSHPNIVRVADFFQENGKFYLVMEFVAGETLEDRLARRGGALSEQEVLPWLDQLCSALTYLHSQQPPIIFRDLKPGNIMLDRSGAIKLIDFGIARRFNPAKRQDTTMLGTPGYAPPEQYGKGQTDARSDIYALGVTTHQLLSGHDPSATPFNLPPLHSLNPTVSPALAELVERCTQRRMDRRPQRVIELRQVVASLLGVGQPIAAQVHPQASTVSPAGQPLAGVSPTVRQPRRPTIRLVQTVAQLTPRQLAIMGGVALVTVVLFVLTAGPWLSVNAPFIGNEVPAFLLAGPLVYAATRRMGPAFIAQAVVAPTVCFAQWARLGTWNSHPELTDFFLGVLLCALVNEISFYVLYQQMPWVKNPDAWKRELAWHCVTMLIAMACFFAPWLPGRLFSPYIWPVSAALGALGWLLGDTAREAAMQAGARWVKP